MATLAELYAKTGVPAHKLKMLERYGLEIEEDEFPLDENHSKALYDLRRKRLSAFVLAYAAQCRIEPTFERWARYDNLKEVASNSGLDLDEATRATNWGQIKRERLPGAQSWIDRATVLGVDRDALERLARWCKNVLVNVSTQTDHNYLAARLLLSLPSDVFRDYPKKVQSALNRTKHYGFLDRWHHLEADEKGNNRTIFHQPSLQFDL